MNAILYICHGSRTMEGQQAARHFIQQTMTWNQASIQVCCFLELASPSIEEGVQRCVQQGATTITAVPLLLLHTGHAKRDIPNTLAKAIANMPHIQLRYGEPLGVQPVLIDILRKRIQQARQPAKQPAVLIVGRGSSDPSIHRYFNTIVQQVKEKTSLVDLTVGYLAASQPSFQTALQTAIAQQPTQLIVLPYLLFAGILTKQITAILQPYMASNFVTLCEPLGNEIGVHQALQQRVKEAKQKGRIIYAVH